MLDGGACDLGIESTVIDLTGDTPTHLRPGMISLGQLQAVLGSVVTAKPPAPAAPSASRRAAAVASAAGCEQHAMSPCSGLGQHAALGPPAAPMPAGLWPEASGALPPGWKRSPSKSRPGQFSYQNQARFPRTCL